MERVISALGALRIPLVTDEYQLQALVAAALEQGGVSFEKEACIAPRSRVDFLCEGGVAVEVKRGRPQKGRLMEQLRRYARSERVRCVVLVVERTADLPRSVGGKPCAVVALNRLWGVAVG